MAIIFSSMLSPDRIINMKGQTKEEVLKEMVTVLGTSPHVKDAPSLLKAILDREKIVSTGIGIGIAVPHVKISSVDDFVVAIGRSHQGVEFDALDGQRVRHLAGTPGQGVVRWDGLNEGGYLVGSGIYLFVARGDSGPSVRGRFAVVQGR